MEDIDPEPRQLSEASVWDVSLPSRMGGSQSYGPLLVIDYTKRPLLFRGTKTGP